jgi:hypothetical protein
MLHGKKGFVVGFISATLISAVVVYAAGEIYTPSRSWIADPALYNLDSHDGVRVLADIAPGTAVQMLEVGVRLNSMNGAVKKKNWDHATYQLEEMQSALEKVSVTRPNRALQIQEFLDTQIAPVAAAITAQDKAAFQSALAGMVTACTQCHVETNHGYLVVKVGKSAAPIE